MEYSPDERLNNEGLWKTLKISLASVSAYFGPLNDGHNIVIPTENLSATVTGPETPRTGSISTHSQTGGYLIRLTMAMLSISSRVPNSQCYGIHELWLLGKRLRWDEASVLAQRLFERSGTSVQAFKRGTIRSVGPSDPKLHQYKSLASSAPLRVFHILLDGRAHSQDTSNPTG